MRVRLSLRLDFDGIHTLEWEPSEAPGAVDVPTPVLARWAKEREAFELAYRRWKHVAEEVEEVLYKAEQSRQPAADPVQPAEAQAVALVQAVRSRG